jgi:FAD-dependent oxidoreductase domain-containing protein 1
MAMSARSESVVIVGGAIVGSFIGYFLQEKGFKGKVTIVERDPTYRFCSTALSAASIRTQFGCAVNIRMSLFGAEFFRTIKNRFGPEADIGFRENGYLILGCPDTTGARKAGLEMQRAEGAEVEGYEGGALRTRFPWLNVDGLGFSTFGTRNEGWFDAWSLLSLVRGRVRQRGGVYVAAEAQSLVERDGRIAAVKLSTGESLQGDWFVNAAGALSARLVAELGIALPVSPRKRTVFALKAPLSGIGFPMLFDTTGAWVRPEGEGFIGGIAPPPDQDPEAFDDFEPHHDLFEETVWPALAHRIPALEQLRVERAWAGHYEVNALDHNGVIGPHDEISNLLFATGFSGHGVMHAPATGRGVAELIVDGGYQSLDLSQLGYDRIRDGRPLAETVVY